MISKRASQWINTPYGLMEGMQLAKADPFSLDQNVAGCINLGTAENELMFDHIQSIVQSSQCLEIAAQDAKYNDFLGIARLRASLSSFINERFEVHHQLKLAPGNVSLHNGCGSAIESLFHVLCDDGDGVLIFTPFYGGFCMDVELRAHVKLIHVPLSSEDGYALNADKLRKVYKDSVAQGVNVKALLLMNPDNPLGVIRSSEEMVSMIKFAEEYDLHLVVDEIYALSVFDQKALQVQRFKSILTFGDVITKPQNVHLLWGFSKDFCVNGFRCGVIASLNQEAMYGLAVLSYFTGVSTVQQKLICDMIEDREWVDSFVGTNMQRLRNAYQTVTQRITAFNESLTDARYAIKYVEAEAGFFIWLNLSPYIHLMDGTDMTVQAKERLLFVDLIENGKLYIAPSSLAFYGAKSESGWFRMIFAAQDQVLKLALDRLFKRLLELQSQSENNK
ncbi:hypothetical protein MIR68_003936 [Amoeboaphelidium protococcarum]|nr:hypothetical protein MIR68_003936 [Amoeboaphelidium protococcarum]